MIIFHASHINCKEVTIEEDAPVMVMIGCRLDTMKFRCPKCRTIVYVQLDLVPDKE